MPLPPNQMQNNVESRKCHCYCLVVGSTLSNGTPERVTATLNGE